MIFDLYGYQLEYGVGLENYNYVRVSNEVFIRKMEKTFENDYYQEFTNIEGAVDGLRRFVLKYLKEAVNWGIDCLNSNGIHTYSEKRFMDEYGEECLEPADDVIGEMAYRYYSIVAAKEEAAQYRRDRKDSRGRWEGGGFGLEGAIKGAMTAGAANMASGLAHSAVNAVGNIGSSISASIQKKDLFNNRSYVRKLRDGVAESMRIVYWNILCILRDNSSFAVEIPKCDEDDLQAQRAVIDNIKNGYLKGNDAILAECAKILQMNPYNVDAYEQFMALCDDPQNKIEEMSVYFGISKCADFKKDKLKKLLEEIGYFDRETLKQGKEKVLAWAVKYCVDTSKIEECLERVDEQLDKNQREVDGFVYDSIELADKVKHQITGITGHIDRTSGNDTSTIRSIIEELENADFLSKEKYVSYLNKQLEEEDIRFRTVLGKLYGTREEAAQARKDAKTLSDAFDFGVLDSEKKINELQDMVDSIVTTDLRELYHSYLEKCSELVSYQKAQIGTTADYGDKLRREYASFFYPHYKYYKISEYMKVLLPEYVNWYINLSTQYRVVCGKSYKTPLEADMAYLKCVEHACSYQKYITEKNAEKKSFFGSIKTAVSGTVYKNYETDYNYVTGNGVRNIPSDCESDKQNIQSLANKTDRLVEEYQQAIESIKKRMNLPYTMPNTNLNASNLIIETKLVTDETVFFIMKDCCPDISVKGGKYSVAKTESEKNSESKSKKQDIEFDEMMESIIDDDDFSVDTMNKERKTSPEMSAEESAKFDKAFEALEYIKNHFTPDQMDEAIQYLKVYTEDETMAEIMIIDLWE
ncbi:MAG: hypothetical protein ACI4E4_09530 [Acetatifactor sp.]